MSQRDAFDDLIKNFKLDDLSDPPAGGQAPVPQVFDYEADIRGERPAPAAARTAASVPISNTGGSARRSVAVAPPAQAERVAKNQREKFEVQIDEREFYSSDAPKPRSGRTGGGGSGGGGGRGPGRGGGRGDSGGDGGAGGRWARTFLTLAALVGISVLLAIFALAVASDLFGLNQVDMQYEFELKEGQSMSQIARDLKDTGIITQTLAFQIYAGIKDDVDAYIPGTYVLNSNMSFDEIMVKFRTGRSERTDVKVLFYEGMTLKQIAQRLEENKVCDADALFAYLEAGEFPWEYEFLDEVSDHPYRFRRYEGYFFPDTYIFYENMKPEAVVQRFFANFNSKMTDEVMEQIKASGMTLDDAITLASIIQGEVYGMDDMRMVSSVFHNRLNDPETFPNLQSDVTREYVDSDIKPYMDVTNQPMYDAYNTDAGKQEGLPVGPVNNPGLDAIIAAVTPETSEYFFFVTDLDGVTLFGKTDAEHEENKRTVSRRNDEILAERKKQQEAEQAGETSSQS